MHDDWCRKLIQHAASLQLAAPSGYDILDPLTFSFKPVSENCYDDLCFGVFPLRVEIRPSAAGGTCVS
jgi:hypothetical protein